MCDANWSGLNLSDVLTSGDVNLGVIEGDVLTCGDDAIIDVIRINVSTTNPWLIVSCFLHYLIKLCR